LDLIVISCDGSQCYAVVCTLSGHFRLNVLERGDVFTQVIRHITVGVYCQQFSATAASQKQQMKRNVSTKII